ncbi:carbon storage regulator [Aporhodopirellula aestuarii]|uniref:Translational regulator CsrA n=1 Tax=Aporhodopirellula aestuarii TaxID=2950107 RepID=A0ABT0TZN0_9BACT|nr:carbon storage regulator [Aporhodopirellula aestuarii]MCM2369956.1 carbon storage regulator [Aporhodopirellula aestuarii]
MLVLSRKIGDKILIGNDIKIIVTKISLNRVRIAIDAPSEMVIMRGELSEALQECFSFPVDDAPAALSLDKTAVGAMAN